MPPPTTPPKLDIKIDDTPLPPDAEAHLLAAVVEDNLNVPDAFELTFSDQFRNTLSTTGIEIGKKVKVTAEGTTLMAGEITALATEYEPGLGTRTIVWGLDGSHRLFRGRHTHTYNNEPYSEIAKTIAQRAGLKAGTIDPTPPPAPDKHVSQANVNDWQFLKWLGSEANREVAVVEGALDFRRGAESSGAPGRKQYETKDPQVLTFGHNLLRFRSMVTSAEQVKEVEVRGWNVRQKQTMVGHAPARTNTASLGVKPEELAGKFGSQPKFVATNAPYGESDNLDEIARHVADHIAGAFAEFDGTSLGSPQLKAGAAVRVQDVGEPFDGQYLLTSTRHVWRPETGYRTHFAVTGKQDRSLLGLTAPGTTNGAATPAGPPISGVVIGVVTDVKDETHSGRVKLRFPWLSDDYESDWARTVQVGAGRDRGLLVVPEVNDEVLVVFEQGDIRRPFVLGGLYNGVDKPKTADYLDPNSGQIVVREFVSRSGHRLRFDERQGRDEAITLVSAQEKCRLVLDEKNNEIVVHVSGAGGKVTIVSQGEVSIEATGGPVKVKGQRIELESQTDVAVKASTGVKIDGGAGVVEIKGSLIKLN